MDKVFKFRILNYSMEKNFVNARIAAIGTDRNKKDLEDLINYMIRNAYNITLYDPGIYEENSIFKVNVTFSVVSFTRFKNYFELFKLEKNMEGVNNEKSNQHN